MDGEIKISETYAISRYIVKKAGREDLLGKNVKDQALLDSLFYIFWENIVGPFTLLITNKKFADVKTAHYYKNKGLYEKFDKTVGGKEYAIGYLTILDFFIA